MIEGTRWSGADWADQQKEIMLIGCGGIGSFTALNLARVGHSLTLIDPDTVDTTNVSGGQLYKISDVGRSKVMAVTDTCRQFGCLGEILPITNFYSPEMGMFPICITGLDNMAARKQVFEEWVKNEDRQLLIDGRLTMEMFEILCIQGNNEDQIREYEEKYLFSDEESVELDCTTKQTTFGAMAIAANIAATLCNWLTNQKLDMELREVPFYQRFFMPIFDYRIRVAEPKKEGLILVDYPKFQIIDDLN